MAVLLDNLIVATLALRPDAAGCLEGSTCFVQATGKRYQVRGAEWQALLDEAQIEADPDIGGGGSGAGVDVAITSLAELAAIETAEITPGGASSVKLWVSAADGSLQCWQLRASTAATVTGSIQRPDDYAESTNEKVWFKC
jgi:hypothetical protein